MTWTFTNAIKHGVIAVTVYAEDDSIVDKKDRKRAKKRWRWRYDANEQTPAEFKAMVRREMRAHIDHLNVSVIDEDVTPDYVGL